MNTIHKAEVDFHMAKKSIDDICIIGAACSDLRKEDPILNERLTSLNQYLQSIWYQIQSRQLDPKKSN
jgi:hypothetical protein